MFAKYSRRQIASCYLRITLTTVPIFISSVRAVIPIKSLSKTFSEVIDSAVNVDINRWHEQGVEVSKKSARYLRMVDVRFYQVSIKTQNKDWPMCATAELFLK